MYIRNPYYLKIIREGSKMECGKYPDYISSNGHTESTPAYRIISLEKTRELVEQLLHVEGHIETGRKDGDMVSMETPPQCSYLQ